MGNHSDGLIMSHARYLAVIHDLENASFGSRCGVGSLIENPSQLAIALRRTMAVVHSRALVVARDTPTQEHSCLWEAKLVAIGPTSAIICCAESTPRPGTSASRFTASSCGRSRFAISWSS